MNKKEEEEDTERHTFTRSAGLARAAPKAPEMAPARSFFHKGVDSSGTLKSEKNEKKKGIEAEKERRDRGGYLGQWH